MVNVGKHKKTGFRYTGVRKRNNCRVKSIYVRFSLKYNWVFNSINFTKIRICFLKDEKRDKTVIKTNI